MKIEVNFNKSTVVVIIGVILILGSLIFAIAYNSNPAAPAVFGHSANEIDGVCRTDGTNCPAFGLDMTIAETIENQVVDGKITALAICPSGYKLIGCSAARDPELLDTCGESNCGYIGVIPVNADGVRSRNRAVGCKAAIDPENNMEAIVHAYCMKIVSS